MSELIIRSIAEDDVFACLSIYNYEVEHGVATLDLEPRTLEEWHEWYNAHSDENCLYIYIKLTVVKVWQHN